jgi:hypothetical protein
MMMSYCLNKLSHGSHRRRRQQQSNIAVLAVRRKLVCTCASFCLASSAQGDNYNSSFCFTCFPSCNVKNLQLD